MVSIIIPTCNRPNTLRQVIDSYINQNNVSELIIVNDGSDKSYKDTVNYIDKKCCDKKIKFKYKINNKRLGAAGARNIGIGLAESKYILWGEDDLYLGHNYIDILLNDKESNNIYFGSIYYGASDKFDSNEEERIKNSYKNDKNKLFNYETLEGYYREDKGVIKKLPFGHAIILVPTEAYNKIKYYEDYKVNGYREETDVQICMQKEGYNMIYNSNAECFHMLGKYIEKGGQHQKNNLILEYYTIVNNNKFLHRHYEYIKREYGLRRTLLGMEVHFFIKRIFFNIKRVINKLK